MSPANKCNGRTLTRGLSLLVCEHSTSSVVVEHPSGRREVLASHWGDRELNAPNDIVTGRDDSIYSETPSTGGCLSTASSATRTSTSRACTGSCRPVSCSFSWMTSTSQTGCASRPATRLYVNDTPRCHIRVFGVAENGSLRGGEAFHENIGTGVVGPTGEPEGGVPDGMKCDELGNVYCTGPDGIWVYEPGGCAPRRHPRTRDCRQPELGGFGLEDALRCRDDVDIPDPDAGCRTPGAVHAGWLIPQPCAQMPSAIIAFCRLPA